MMASSLFSIIFTNSQNCGVVRAIHEGEDERNT